MHALKGASIGILALAVAQASYAGSEIREEIASALDEQDYRERIRRLHTVIDQRTDGELLNATPEFFPDQVLVAAGKQGSCNPESARVLTAVRYALNYGAETYFRTRSDEFRQELKALVSCIQYEYPLGFPEDAASTPGAGAELVPVMREIPI